MKETRMKWGGKVATTYFPSIRLVALLSFVLTFGIFALLAMILVFTFGLSTITYLSIAVVPPILGLFTQANIPHGYVGVVTFLGKRQRILLEEGTYFGYLPLSIFLNYKLVPIIVKSDSISFSDTTSNDGIPIRGSIGFDYFSLDPYLTSKYTPDLQVLIDDREINLDFDPFIQRVASSFRSALRQTKYNDLTRSESYRELLTSTSWQTIVEKNPKTMEGSVDDELVIFMEDFGLAITSINVNDIVAMDNKVSDAMGQPIREEALSEAHRWKARVAQEIAILIRSQDSSISLNEALEMAERYVGNRRYTEVWNMYGASGDSVERVAKHLFNQDNF